MIIQPNLPNELSSLSVFTKHKGREMLRKEEREGRADDTTATRSETKYINSELSPKSETRCPSIRYTGEWKLSRSP